MHIHSHIRVNTHLPALRNTHTSPNTCLYTRTHNCMCTCTHTLGHAVTHAHGAEVGSPTLLPSVFPPVLASASTPEEASVTGMAPGEERQPPGSARQGQAGTSAGVQRGTLSLGWSQTQARRLCAQPGNLPLQAGPRQPAVSPQRPRRNASSLTFAPRKSEGTMVGAITAGGENGSTIFLSRH